MTGPVKPAPFSVIIPAHNEGAVIERCLASLLRDAPDPPPEIIVVANGCKDDTAARARAFGPAVTVIELEIGSKTIAMNEGNAAARTLPRFFLDADTDVSFAALAAAAEPLIAERALAAAPALRFDFTDVHAPARWFSAIVAGLPSVRGSVLGRGVYGLSAEGLKRVFPLPQIIADDLFVAAAFSPSERISVDRDQRGAPVFSRVRPPRTLKALISVETRQLAGNEELSERFARPATDRGSTLRHLRALALNPRHWPGLAIFVCVKAAGRLRYAQAKRRGDAARWRRDESARTS